MSASRRYALFSLVFLLLFVAGLAVDGSPSPWSPAEVLTLASWLALGRSLYLEGQKGVCVGSKRTANGRSNVGLG